MNDSSIRVDRLKSTEVFLFTHFRLKFAITQWECVWSHTHTQRHVITSFGIEQIPVEFHTCLHNILHLELLTKPSCSPVLYLSHSFADFRPASQQRPTQSPSQRGVLVLCRGAVGKEQTCYTRVGVKKEKSYRRRLEKIRINCSWCEGQSFLFIKCWSNRWYVIISSCGKCVRVINTYTHRITSLCYDVLWLRTWPTVRLQKKSPAFSHIHVDIVCFNNLVNTLW